MSVKRDPRTGRWFFRTTVRFADGTKERVFGTPGVPGPYHDLAPSKVGALEAERRAIANALAGKPIVSDVRRETEVATVPTVAEFAERFLIEYLPRQKPSARYAKERIVRGKNGLIGFFGPLRLDEIDQPLINRYVASMSKLATKTINERLTVLSTMLKYAGPKGCKLIPESMLSMHIDGAEAEIVAVPAADVAKLIAACTDERYRVAVLLASEAGLRIGEIRGVQWTDIRDGRITIRRAIDTRNNVTTPKHDKTRTVKLSPALVSALETLPRRGIWIVTRLDDGGMLTYWAMWEALRALYTKAGVTIPVSETGESMPWHSLRHSYGTEMAARGVPLPVLQQLMGHEDIATTMRYVTVNRDQMDAAIDRVFGERGSHVAADSETVR